MLKQELESVFPQAQPASASTRIASLRVLKQQLESVFPQAQPASASTRIVTLRVLKQQLESSFPQAQPAGAPTRIASLRVLKQQLESVFPQAQPAVHPRASDPVGDSSRLVLPFPRRPMRGQRLLQLRTVAAGRRRSREAEHRTRKECGPGRGSHSQIRWHGSESERRAFAALRKEIQGELLLPSPDGRYEQARRLWNGLIDKRPALILACAEAGMWPPQCISPPGTGCCSPCAAAGTTSPAARFATAGWSSIFPAGGGGSSEGHRARGGRRPVRGPDRATQAHGLAVPVWLVSATGIGGLALHGGLGWLARRYRMTWLILFREACRANWALRFRQN